MTFISLTAGIESIGQFPSVGKTYTKTLADLRDLGENNNRAFKFYDGLHVYCLETDRTYKWREEKEPGESNGLINGGFTYPANSVANEIDYSNRTFNWFIAKISTDIIDGEVNREKVTYTWLKFSPNADGTQMQDTPDGMSYMGISVENTLPESEDPNSLIPSFYIWTPIGDSVSYIGKDGQTYYIHVKYAESSSGDNMSDLPEGKNYIGLSYRNLTPIESDNPDDYEWSAIQGDITEITKIIYEGDGSTENIKSYYTWLKFSASPDGTDMQDSPEGMSYYGIAVNKLLPESEDPDSNSPSFYIWAPIGEVASYVGADGITYYIHTKYSDYSDGKEMTDEAGMKRYIGISYRNLVPEESDNPDDYEWSLILSDIQEQPKILYQWFKFADDELGTNMSDSPIGKTHMGIAIDQLSPEESDNPSHYTWNPLTGPQGYIGPDGKTYFIWIKWAITNTPAPNEMFDDPEGMLYMGVSEHQSSMDESLNYLDYNWSKTALNTLSINQNNKIRVIEISEEELTSLNESGFANWVNENLVKVLEDEIVVIEVKGASTPIPTLDVNIPLALSVSNIGETTVDASWDNNGDTAIVRYELYFTPKLGGQTRIVTTNQITASLTNLLDNTEYLAYVIGFDTLGNEKQSNTIEFITDKIFIASTPVLQLDGLTDTTVDFSWDIEAAFGADRFELHQVGTGVIYDGPNKSFEVTGLTENTLYEFYVIAYNGATPSNESVHSIITTLVSVDPPLTKPTLTFLSATISQISFSIGGIPKIEYSRIVGYEGRYKKLTATNWLPFPTNNSNLQILSDLTDTETYEIQIRSLDGNVESPWSDSLIASTEDLEAAKLSLRLRPYIEEAPPEYIGSIFISDGVPNSVVSLEIKLDVTWNNQAFPGQIEFLTTQVYGTSRTVNSGRSYIFEVSLDENGQYGDVYRLIEDVSGNYFGTQYKVTASLLTSENGIDPLYASETITHLSGESGINQL